MHHVTHVGMDRDKVAVCPVSNQRIERADEARFFDIRERRLVLSVLDEQEFEPWRQSQPLLELREVELELLGEGGRHCHRHGWWPSSVRRLRVLHSGSPFDESGADPVLI